METKWVKAEEFAAFVQSKEKRDLVVVDDKYRWKITEADGSEYIVRPEPVTEI